jgi:peptide/nickel transport system permease protein
MTKFGVEQTSWAGKREQVTGRRFPASLAAGMIGVVLLILPVALGPLVLPYAPNDLDLSSRLLPPSSAHWLGTDNFGRDLLTRLLHAGRVDLQICIFATLYTFFIGSTLGALAGFYEGRLDAVLMRLLDVLLAFPTLVLVIAIVAMLGPGLFSLYVAIGLVGWVPYARLVRGEVIVTKHMDYVLAARALGCNDGQLIWRHLLPNALAPAIVFAASDAIFNILAAASLGFLGLGVRPPDPEWGTLIAEGRSFYLTHPGLVIFPGLALSVTGLIFSLLGDGLTDALRPIR